jgi:hypothetical protein
MASSLYQVNKKIGTNGRKALYQQYTIIFSSFQYYPGPGWILEKHYVLISDNSSHILTSHKTAAHNVVEL